MANCRHAILHQAKIESAGGAIIQETVELCSLKRESPTLRLEVISSHRACGLPANDDGCPCLQRQLWERCAYFESK